MHQVGQALCYYFLPESERVIVRSTIQALSQDDMNSNNVQQAIKQLDYGIESKIAEVKQPNLLQEAILDIYEPYEPEAEKPEVDDFTPESYDAMISAKLLIPKRGRLSSCPCCRSQAQCSGKPGWSHTC